jgi:bacterioferritin-associated ferredoxin
MELDDEICLCFHVTKRKILNYIRIHEPRVPSEISACGGAGTGCGWCVSFLKKYFDDRRKQLTPADAISAQEYARSRGRYIHSGRGIPPAGATPPPDDSENG